MEVTDAANLEGLRTWLGSRIRGLLVGDEVPRHSFERPPGDTGLFGPGSATWAVHADLSMLVGGLRALLLQTLHPLAMAGVAQHSNYRTDPWRRFRRTTAFVTLTTYGSTAAAEDAIAAVQRVHERVTGVSRDGLPYRATDPELLAWVHATEVDSFARAYRRYGRGRLDGERLDAYVAEMSVVASRLGVPRPPRSWAELQGYLRAIRPHLRATAEARRAVRFLLAPPLSVPAVPAYSIVAAAAVGLLPAYARRELWLPMPALVEPLAVRPAGTALLQLMGWALGPPPHAEDGGAPRRDAPASAAS